MGIVNAMGRRLNEWTRRWLPLITAIATVGTVAGAFFAYKAFDDKGVAQPSQKFAPGLSTLGGQSASQTGEGARTLMWDESGLREPIFMRDEFTPWRDYPFFNGIVNGPFGDERQFLRAVVVGRSNQWSQTVHVSPGDTVEVKVTVVNEAEPILNEHGRQRGIARNTRVVVARSPYKSADPSLFAVVSADNASPRWIASRVFVVATEPVILQYKRNSTRVYRYSEDGQRLPSSDTGSMDGEIDRADELAGRGLLVGTEAADGNLKAGSDQGVEVLMQFTVE